VAHLLYGVGQNVMRFILFGLSLFSRPLAAQLSPFKNIGLCLPWQEKLAFRLTMVIVAVVTSRFH
jgi:hypothetical protein